MSTHSDTPKKPDLPVELMPAIISAYRETIHIPSPQTSRQFLLCPIGLIGSGKTTVIKVLAEKLKLIRISTDEVRKLLQDKGYNFKRTKDIVAALIKIFLDQESSVAIDGNCGSKAAHAFVKDIIATYGIKDIWIHVNPPEEFIINNLRNFKHMIFNNGDEAVRSYFKYKKDFPHYVDSDTPVLYQFDTSRGDLPHQLNQAEELILEELGDVMTSKRSRI